MSQHLMYDQVKTEGLKKKILEFNGELNVLEGQELVYFESMIKVLTNVQNYHRTEISPQQLRIIDKLLAFPVEKAFPCMDLYRIYLLHPSSYEAYAASDAGITYINTMIRFLSDEGYPKNIIMLTLRAMCNLFKNQSNCSVALLNREKLIDATMPHLSHSDKNVRQAGITLLLNFSVEFNVREDQEGRV